MRGILSSVFFHMYMCRFSFCPSPSLFPLSLFGEQRERCHPDHGSEARLQAPCGGEWLTSCTHQGNAPPAQRCFSLRRPHTPTMRLSHTHTHRVHIQKYTSRRCPSHTYLFLYFATKRIMQCITNSERQSPKPVPDPLLLPSHYNQLLIYYMLLCKHVLILLSNVYDHVL